MTQKILTYSFYALFALTPLIWAPFNYELFEFNKMMFVYALTLVIVTCWVLKMIKSKSLILKTTPLDLPLMLFLSANILSTIFSTDRHISIFGYYSRLNGGLISLISYLLLYYALISNFNKEQALNFLKAAVLGGIPVALWAIPEHFGISPSCIILTGQANASCWIQDVQARVFATLGQPNWLASYLAMLIFPAFYFLLNSTTKFPLILTTCYLILFYLAFTFTYSRGATLGLLTGLAVFFGAILWQTLRCHPKGVKLNFSSISHLGGGILLAFLIINLFFGFALTDFKLLSKFAPPSRPALTSVSKSGTQLENGGTESGKIRLIVWQGALEIFKHYPIFGSGVETFAYAYYQHRPASHNLVSEWDFLYNKAHNEFLNYLATTGLMGLLSYIIIVITFIIVILKKQKSNNLLIYSLLASYISYLVQNFFGFSVVITALFFYLFPALAFITSDSVQSIKVPSTFHYLSSIFQSIYKRPFYTKFAQGVVILIFSLSIFTTIKFYLADIYFAQGMKLSDSNPGKAYNTLFKAAALNPQEPFYKSELAYQAAAASLSLEKEDASLSSQLKKQADEQTSSLLLENPNNVSYFRTAIRTYFLLSSIDQKFADKTLQTLDAALKLAPTDAKLLYNKGIILSQQEKNKEAISALEQTQKLKPNYKEAYLMLGTLYAQEKEWEKAREQMEKLLEIIPGDPQALEKLTEWQEK